MRACLAVSVLLAVLPGCGGEKSEAWFEVFTGTPPEERSRLELGESRLGAQAFYFPLIIRSKAPKAATLKLRLEDAAPPGLQASLLGESQVLREMTVRPRLQIIPPSREGPWSARIRLYCDELPDWSYEWFVTGDVVKRPPSGVFLSVAPPGLDLGKIREGASVPVVFELTSVGTDALVVAGWQPGEEGLLTLPEVPRGGIQLATEETHRLEGSLLAPHAPGPFRTSITVRTNMPGSPARRIWIEGEVVTEYRLDPPVLTIPAIYPPNAQEFVLVVRHESGEKPLAIGAATGHEQWFELVEGGGGEPATEKRLRFRIRPDAPRGPARFKVRLTLLPEEREIEWRVALVVVPSIVADPAQLDFGKVAAGTAASREVQLRSFAGRPFRVTAARSEKGTFLPDFVERPDGGWTIRVHLRPGLGAGVPHLDRIWIETDDPETRKLVVEAYVEMR